MATSEARLLANRQNALKSTGPRTVEGKERSRLNALKHGLCATILVAEDLASIQARSDEWFHALKPQNPHQAWLVDQVSIASLRIDRVERMERRLRDRAMLRAELAWDDDRRIEVEDLALRLDRTPSLTSRKLQSTPQGCDWLIARWSFLANSAEQGLSWTIEQTRLAFDLLGTPLEAREGRKPGDLVDLGGQIIEPAPSETELARSQVERLRERRVRVADLDEVDRAIVEADQFDEPNVELKRLRRYENTIHNRLRWFVAQVKEPSPPVWTRPDLRPNWVEPEVEGKPAPEVVNSSKPISPPFDLKVEEIPPLGQKPDIPRIVADRRQKRTQKAQARREAKRRKVERLRA